MRAIEAVLTANKRITRLIGEGASESRILPLISSSRALRITAIKQNPEIRDAVDVERYKQTVSECETLDRAIHDWLRTENPSAPGMSKERFAHALLPLVFDYKSDMALVSGVPGEIIEEWARAGLERLCIVDSDDKGHPRALHAYISSLSSPIGNLFCHRMPEAKTSPEFFRECALAARDAAQALSTYTNTLRLLGETVFDNLVQNLPQITKIVTDIQTPGVEVFVLCAGPSLKDVLPLLPRLREKGVVVALSHTLRTLFEADVKPDFVIAADPQAVMMEHLKGLDVSDLVLLGSASLAPAFLRAGWKEVYAFGCHEDLDGWAGLPHVPTGGSAAGAALNLALKWGASGVTYLGHDLAFGSAGERYGATGIPGWQELAQTEVPGVHGGTVKTSEAMDLFRRWYEDAARQLRTLRPDFMLRVASSKGARVAGWEHVDLQDLLKVSFPARQINTIGWRDGRPTPSPTPLARLAADLDSLAFQKRLHEKAKGFLGRKKREIETRALLQTMTWRKGLPQRDGEDFREYLGRLVGKRELLPKEVRHAVGE